jgi:hypothetical protein
MDPNRKRWNEGQKALKQALASAQDSAIDLFLRQHAQVHSAELSPTRPTAPALFSFADEIWQDMDEPARRRIPDKETHSVAWIFWHLARIEDVTMNLLVAGSSQLLDQEDWLDRLGVSVQNTGNGMQPQDVADLSAAIDLDALRAYRLAVGRNTREIVQRLEPGAFKTKVDPARIQQIWDQGAMLPSASGIVDYWSRRTIAGLLLMPPTRHCFLHLNEARRVKKRRK